MDSMKLGRVRSAFTLIELLVVIGIIAVIAAILFPVFAGIRERGRRTQCLSNERQLGMAILQYAGDNNETLFVAKAYSMGGLGWAGECYPYVKSAAVFRCPNDATSDVRAGDTGSLGGWALSAVSYGFNSNLAGQQVPALPNSRPIPSVALGQVIAPARTVLLFEISDSVVPLAVPSADDESAWGNVARGAAPIGPKGPISDPTFPMGYSSTSLSTLASFATGNMGGMLLNGATKDGITLPGAKGSKPRHGDGANYAACDGHVVWLRSEQVSPGNSAEASDSPPVSPALPTLWMAAGTANPRYALTFSSK